MYASGIHVYELLFIDCSLLKLHKEKNLVKEKRRTLRHARFPRSPGTSQTESANRITESDRVRQKEVR